MKIILIAMSLFLAACGFTLDAGGHKIIDTQDQNKTESYKYSFESNGCKTGEKAFSSKDAYCNGLKDDASNNYCARDIRYDQFKAECPGKNW